MTLNHDLKHIFVTATDTDVGKTIISLLLLKIMQENGQKPFYVKPFQTGCPHPNDPLADASFIAGYLDDKSAVDADKSTLCCLSNPKAPWMASMDARVTIEPDQTIQKLNRLKKGARPLVIEGAGGLMVPITKDFFMLDLMACLDVPVVLVARDGLGTINHTLLSLAALKIRGITVCAVVLTASDPIATHSSMIAENKMAIEHFSKIPVAGAIDWIEDFNAVTPKTKKIIGKVLDLAGHQP